MKNFIYIFLLILVSSVNALAQAGNEVLAKIGSQSFTVNDLSPQAQETATRLPVAIAETRRSELDKNVSELLFAAEAAARKTTSDKLLDLEVRKKIANPTVSQIQAVYDVNREAFGSETLDEAKTRIVNYLRREQEDKLTASFADSLKPKYKFLPGADPNTPNLKPTDVLATVGTEKILAAKFNEHLKPLEFYLRQSAYEQIKFALDDTIYSNLILLEARKQNLPPEDFIRREITDKLREPTEQDAQKFYNEQKAQFENVSFDTAKTQILSYLADDQRGKIENELSKRLMAQNNVQILLAVPKPPVLNISASNSPSKGRPNAPVTIVMFTDFQCPSCARMHPVVSEVVKTYGAKVRFVVRDFPLITIHENAFRAAQAAAAANAQGKFFEYIDVLYKNQKALDDDSLKKYAAQLKLDIKQFEIDLGSGKFDSQIHQDIKDGEQYGIRSTPTIYINGVISTGLTDEAIKNLIKKALAGK
ncbi:MAG: thioredoxin domain-containing protein [Pyrinomonadaceae bacterium]